METKELEVRFDIWCPKCKYHKLEEHWDPCNDCLDYCSNGQSTKPTRFVAASGFEDWVPGTDEEIPEETIKVAKFDVGLKIDKSVRASKRSKRVRRTKKEGD